MTNTTQIVNSLDQKILADSGVDSLEEILKIFLLKLFDEIKNNNRYFQARKFDNANKMLQVATKEYPNITLSNKFLLSDKVLEECLNEISHLNLFNEGSDTFDAAIEHLLPHVHRGNRGQFMTPRYICREIINFLSPKMTDSLFDPACGSGGFLEHAILFQNKENRTNYTLKRIHGSDYDEKMTRLTRLSCLKNAKLEGDIKTENSLKKNTNKNLHDITVSNPPYGGKITDIDTLNKFELSKNKQGIPKPTDKHILFIEKCITSTNQGGKICIILPQGVLNNSRMEKVHEYIYKTCRVIGVVSLPQNTFMPHTNVKTSILILKKWDKDFKEDYRVFLDISQKSGKDKKGRILYKNKMIDHDLNEILKKLKIFLTNEKIDWE